MLFELDQSMIDLNDDDFNAFYQPANLPKLLFKKMYKKIKKEKKPD